MEAENNIANERERIFDQLQEEYSLTDREKELCHYIYDGKSNAEIAETLFITESTVKTHIYNLYKKTGVKSRMEIIRIVREQQN
jgi:DNA-binding CsgD family transcriptional regulator